MLQRDLFFPKQLMGGISNHSSNRLLAPGSLVTVDPAFHSSVLPANPIFFFLKAQTYLLHEDFLNDLSSQRSHPWCRGHSLLRSRVYPLVFGWPWNYTLFLSMHTDLSVVAFNVLHLLLSPKLLLYPVCAWPTSVGCTETVTSKWQVLGPSIWLSLTQGLIGRLRKG